MGVGLEKGYDPPYQLRIVALATFLTLVSLTNLFLIFYKKCVYFLWEK